MAIHFVKCATCRFDVYPALNTKIHGIDFTGTDVTCPFCLMELESDVIVTECGHLYCEGCWMCYELFGSGSVTSYPPSSHRLEEEETSSHPSPLPPHQDMSCPQWERDAPDYTESRGEQEFYNYSLRGMRCGWGCGNVASSWVKRNATRDEWRACCAAPTFVVD